MEKKIAGYIEALAREFKEANGILYKNIPYDLSPPGPNGRVIFWLKDGYLYWGNILASVLVSDGEIVPDSLLFDAGDNRGNWDGEMQTRR